MNLNKLIRKNVLAMKAYSAARYLVNYEDMQFLDANENPFGEWNRYPDPLQKKLKAKLAQSKGCNPDTIVFGNGSDEILDLLIRAFCEPGLDNVVTHAPGYGMYQTLCELNNVALKEVLLNPDFSLSAKAMLDSCNENTKIMILCSPNNPTGNSFKLSDMQYLAQNFKGILVIDEAYIDFSAQESMLSTMDKFDNLVIIQTFSKAWGMAALRTGMAFMHPELAALLNKIKLPYNINLFSQQFIVNEIYNATLMHEKVALLLSEREPLRTQLLQLPYITEVFPSDANFILFRTEYHSQLQDYLLQHQFIVRSRHTMPLCNNTLRITIGSPEQNRQLIALLQSFKPSAI